MSTNPLFEDGPKPGKFLSGHLVIPFGIRSYLTKADFKALFQNSFLVYACFLMLGSVLYHQIVGSSFQEMSVKDCLGYLSTVAEGFGLLSLRWKIRSHQSAAGISGASLLLFGLCYTFRAVFAEMPPFSVSCIDAWLVKILEWVSWLLVLDVIRLVFFSYRKTYRADLDILRVQYIVPACVVLAFVVRPHDESFGWTVAMYMDTVALMPQVVMMSRGDGLVGAPIAHFVAATAFSRAVDLYSWCWGFHEFGMSYDAWVVLTVHVTYQLLFADFSYYYLKQRLALRSLSEDLILPEDDII